VQLDLTDSTTDAVLESGATVFTVAEARELVAMFARVTSAKDADAFLDGFTDDCVVQYGAFPMLTGKKALRTLVKQMFSPRFDNFVCRKSLRCLNGNVIGGSWVSDWVDLDTGTRRSGRGFEFWIMRGRKIARWDAAFNEQPVRARRARR